MYYKNIMELGRDKTVAKIISQLKTAQASRQAVKVEGTWGSFARLLTAYISDRLKKPILYICPHIDDADKAADDLHAFGAQKIEPLPAWEGAEDLADATDEIRAERLKIVSRISYLASRSRKDKLIIPTSVQALCQPIPKPKVLEQSCLRLQVERRVSPEEVAGWLVDNGFERVERVDLPGQFARRGGIVDIYAPLVSEKSLRDKLQEPRLVGTQPALSANTAEAVRMEFFGDTIESIRQIDLDTHRSCQQIESIGIVSVVCGADEEDSELFVNILPEDTVIILEEPADIEEVAKVFLERLEDTARLYSWTDIYAAIERFTQLHLCRFATSATEDFLKVDIRSVQQFQHKAASLWEGSKDALLQLAGRAKQGEVVCLYCESEAQVKRITEIVKQSYQKLPANFKLLPGFIHQGFIVNSLNTIIISHHELFGQVTLRRRPRPMRAGAPVDTLSDLQPGDYVVHASYGIGKFLGVKTIREGPRKAVRRTSDGGTQKDGAGEYLTVEYADGVKIHVSVRNIALVQKYIGTSPKRPKLSKVGSKRWQRQKEKVARCVRDLAADLLEIQAKRAAIGGVAFGPDSNWQVEFEQSFPYQETPDQTTVAEQIKADMQQPVAMDRLLCGDVGYGKTELAMRAAFKAVENGKQVAILVPTTVLCVQHGRTLAERFADFPISIEILNRFKTPKQAADIIARTRAGRVDILIGTHRLLSGDVGFKDLGLLIIDEEQRFGVEHKVKLKKLRINPPLLASGKRQGGGVNVDVLTMTATPIPRTLHMSLLGLRDISSLGTPPLDRRSIVTTVTAYNKELIRKAIIRELNRQGQVFFLHNRVKTIEKKAWEIQKLLPRQAKVTIAHGRMPKSELEAAMIDFVMGETDVLVCTTIIESGLDIPNANTIFINDADRFGLAELHQLRGRVGRYKHRAFAYMLLPPSRPITPLAARRLKAIEEYSHLGAGFRIALRDLEIRGAGNILGPEQSGHIQTVGYQMYCELLADAVKQIKNEDLQLSSVEAPVESIPPFLLSQESRGVIDLGFTTYIPKNYIPSDRQRMDAYRKIAVARSSEELKQIENELSDIYGPPPDEVELLLDLAWLGIQAAKWNIKSIVTTGADLVFSFAKDAAANADSLFAKVSGKVRIPNPKTVYLRLPKNYFVLGTPPSGVPAVRRPRADKRTYGEPRTMISALRKIFSTAS